MELQFQSKRLDYLNRILWDTRQEEQTQELKLPDAMPDIGRVLATWGQVVLRSKEWRGTGISLNGGVMVWVLYAPEDGSQNQCLETWIPFQTHWDFPQSQRDGTAVARCLLCGADSRAVSARKLMIRACVSICAEALEPTASEVFYPEQIPQDICLLSKKYPICLPVEASEKMFTMEGEIQPDIQADKPFQVICHRLDLQVAEKTVMGDKLVFRGKGFLRCLLRLEDGSVKAVENTIPFSQYTDLEKEYSGQCTASVIPVLTNLELEIQENGSLYMKAGVLGQYILYDQPVVEVVEDAYSPSREVKLDMQRLQLPAILEMGQTDLEVRQRTEAEATEVVDVWTMAEQPGKHMETTGCLLHQPGAFQILYRDREGNIQNTRAAWEEGHSMETAPGCQVYAASSVTEPPSGAMLGDMLQAQCSVSLETVTVSQSSIPMVAGLDVGEAATPDPDRPSLILRRVGSDSLWEIAKQCATTREVIEAVNQLQEPMDPEQILLIPVP